MGRYLTNTELENEARCRWAAEQSGFNVEFFSHPIPHDPWEHEFDDYNPAVFYGVYGSVYTNEIGRDHGPFWEAWERYTPPPQPLPVEGGGE